LLGGESWRVGVVNLAVRYYSISELAPCWKKKKKKKKKNLTVLACVLKRSSTI